MKQPISRLVLMHERGGKDAVIPFASIVKIEPHNELTSRVYYTRPDGEHVMYVDGTPAEVKAWVNSQLFPEAR